MDKLANAVTLAKAKQLIEMQEIASALAFLESHFALLDHLPPSPGPELWVAALSSAVANPILAAKTDVPLSALLRQFTSLSTKGRHSVLNLSMQRTLWIPLGDSRQWRCDVPVVFCGSA